VRYYSVNHLFIKYFIEPKTDESYVLLQINILAGDNWQLSKGVIKSKINYSLQYTKKKLYRGSHKNSWLLTNKNTDLLF
jgi:hypothetical protein